MQGNNKKNIENLVLHINNSGYGEISKGKPNLILKRFYKWLYDNDNYPELVSWLKAGNVRNTKKASNMLREKMTKAAHFCIFQLYV